MMLRQLSLISVLAMFMAFSVGVACAEVSLVNQYDPNGNLVSGDGKYYEYNDANQLAKVRENDQNGKVIAEYFYDFTGQRAKKVENGVTTYYIGKHYETNLVAGKVENSSYFFADEERVAKKDSTGTYFYHPDHLDGVNAVTNAAGAVVAKTSYLPFGEIRQGGQEKFSYTGKEKDKATDLYYFDARFNSPELRHFTQADIAEPDFDDPQNLNKYAYVGNNPLSYVDPDGYKPKKPKKNNKLTKNEKKILKEAKKVAKNHSSYVKDEGNCKVFASNLVKNATDKNLPLTSTGYAQSSIDKVKAGDVLQDYSLPHTAIVLKATKKYITVLEANYQTEGTPSDIRVRTKERSVFESYKVYIVPK